MRSLLASAMPRLFSTVTFGGRTDMENPAAWLREWAGIQNVAGMPVSTESALRLAAYHACLRVVAEDTAKVPLVVYERLDPRGRRRATEHAAYPVLHDQMNPYMGAYVGRELLVHWALGWGLGAAEIQWRKDGSVEALWPIHPSRIRIDTDQGRPVYLVRSDDPDLGAVEVPFEQEDLFLVHGMGSDGYAGYSAARYGAHAIGVGLAAQEFRAAFFANDSTPGLVFVHPETIDEDAYQRMRKSWTEAHGGPMRAWRPAFLEEGVKPERLGIPPRDAQMIEASEFSVEEICRFFRVDPGMIGHHKQAKGWATVEAFGTSHAVNCLHAWFVRIEQEAWRKLLGGDHRFIAEHAAQGLMRGDFQARTEGYAKGISAGWLSPNDVRELENLNPIPGEEGDMYYMQGAMAPLDKLAEADEPEPPPVPPVPPDEEDEEEEEEPPEDAAERDPAPDASLLAALHEVLVAAARPVIAKERMAVARAVKRHDRDPEALVQWIRKFYAEQVEYAGQVLLPPVRALSVAIRGTNGVETRLPAALETWAEACVQRAFAQQQAGALVRIVSNHVEDHVRELAEVGERVAEGE